MLDVQNEYQLIIPTPKYLGRISEQSKFEDDLPKIRENYSQKQKPQKFEFRQINSSRLIALKTDKIQNQDKVLQHQEKPLLYFKASQQSQLSKSKSIRSITEHQSPQKQYTVRSHKTNTDTDEIIVHTDEEKGKIKFKRDERKRKTSNYKAGLNENPQNKQLNEQIQRLIHQLLQLKEYLNNSRKLFIVVRNLVGTRKNLRKVLLKNGKEELVDFSDIIKYCSIKEFVNINGEQKLIERLNLTLLEDICYANEVLENLLVQNQILGIKRIADQVSYLIILIKLEKNEINRLKGILKISSDDDLQLSISSGAMSRYNLHEQVDMLEQRLGPLQSIQKQVKQTSQAITTIVKFLNDP